MMSQQQLLTWARHLQRAESRKYRAHLARQWDVLHKLDLADVAWIRPVLDQEFHRRGGDKEAKEEVNRLKRRLMSQALEDALRRHPVVLVGYWLAQVWVQDPDFSMGCFKDNENTITSREELDDALRKLSSDERLNLLHVAALSIPNKEVKFLVTGIMGEASDLLDVCPS